MTKPLILLSDEELVADTEIEEKLRWLLFDMYDAMTETGHKTIEFELLIRMTKDSLSLTCTMTRKGVLYVSKYGDTDEFYGNILVDECEIKGWFGDGFSRHLDGSIVYYLAKWLNIKGNC